MTEGSQLFDNAFALVALDDERSAITGAACAAPCLECLEEGIEFGVSAGDAGDTGGRLPAAALPVALDTNDAVIGWGAGP